MIWSAFGSSSTIDSRRRTTTGRLVLDSQESLGEGIRYRCVNPHQKGGESKERPVSSLAGGRRHPEELQHARQLLRDEARGRGRFVQDVKSIGEPLFSVVKLPQSCEKS